MTLSRYESDLYCSLLLFKNESGSNSDLFLAFYNFSWMNSTTYATIVSNFNTWADADEAGTLYLTSANGTYKAPGIDKRPSPPQSK